MPRQLTTFTLGVSVVAKKALMESRASGWKPKPVYATVPVIVELRTDLMVTSVRPPMARYSISMALTTAVSTMSIVKPSASMLTYCARRLLPGVVSTMYMQ